MTTTGQNQDITPPAPESPRSRAWIKWVSIVITVVGVFIAYLSLAGDRGWIPFDDESRLTINKPESPYKAQSDFTVEVSGKLDSSRVAWILARDARHVWFPLSEASFDARRKIWVADIRHEQLGPSGHRMELHVVATNSNAEGQFTEYMQHGNFKEGLEELPDGARSNDRITVEVLPRA